MQNERLTDFPRLFCLLIMTSHRGKVSKRFLGSKRKIESWKSLGFFKGTAINYEDAVRAAVDSEREND